MTQSCRFPRYVEITSARESHLAEGGTDSEERLVDIICVPVKPLGETVSQTEIDTVPVAVKAEAMPAAVSNLHAGGPSDTKTGGSTGKATYFVGTALLCLPADVWYRLCGIIQPGNVLYDGFYNWLKTVHPSQTCEKMEQILQSLAWPESCQRTLDMSLEAYCGRTGSGSSTELDNTRDELLETTDKLYDKFMSQTLETKSNLPVESENLDQLKSYVVPFPDPLTPHQVNELISRYWSANCAERERSQLPASVPTLLEAKFRVQHWQSIKIGLLEAGAEAEYASHYLITPPPGQAFEHPLIFAPKVSRVKNSTIRAGRF